MMTENEALMEEVMEEQPEGTGYYFDKSYDEALRALRREVKEDAVRSRPQKDGPIGFVAGEGAPALEKDGEEKSW
ncbi:hypothetical protein GCK32_007223 [Trichostrongylus colubriformis]|uniref:Uncharacterized protein n=1 Tax=Trichostrongylus colubriformis TaxID=6319 RepID=A0AAN8EZR2_TRICO